MTKPLRRLLAGLSLTTATLTGSILATGIATADTAPASTTVTTPSQDGTDDSWWGSAPADRPTAAPVAPMDSWWG